MPASLRKALFLLMLAPSLCFAHGTATTMQATSGPYLIEFEHDNAGNVEAGRPTIFTVRLLDPKSNADIPFDSASLAILRADGTSLLAGNLYPFLQSGSLGGSMQAILPQAADYSANVSFLKGGKEIASSSFAFTASPSTIAGAASPESGARSAVELAFAAIAGVIAGIFIERLHKKRHEGIS